MTQEEKDLLLKDLCARLPYGVIINIPHIYRDKFKAYLKAVNPVREIIYFEIPNSKSPLFDRSILGIKPYLRPISSMTEEENKIVDNISNKGKGFEEDEDGWIRCDSIHTKWGVWPDGCANLLDYLNSIHIDYRGLIEKGLALEAPEGMY